MEIYCRFTINRLLFEACSARKTETLETRINNLRTTEYFTELCIGELYESFSTHANFFKSSVSNGHKNYRCLCGYLEISAWNLLNMYGIDWEEPLSKESARLSALIAWKGQQSQLPKHIASLTFRHRNYFFNFSILCI